MGCACQCEELVILIICKAQLLLSVLTVRLKKGGGFGEIFAIKSIDVIALLSCELAADDRCFASLLWLLKVKVLVEHEGCCGNTSFFKHAHDSGDLLLEHAQFLCFDGSELAMLELLDEAFMLLEHLE